MPCKVMIPTNYYQEARRYLADRGYELLDCPSSATGEERRQMIRDVDAVIARTELYTEEMIDCATHLKIIARAGVGTENI